MAELDLLTIAAVLLCLGLVLAPALCRAAALGDRYMRDEDG